MSKQQLLLALGLGVVLAAGLVACGEDEAPTTSAEGTTTTTTTPPATTPPATTPPVTTPPPIEPLPTPEVAMNKVLLGRRLFHDTRLSGDGTLSCATCHSLDAGGAEHRPVSVGIATQNGPINAPTVLNSAHNFVQFWDGRAATLEEQAAGPVANPIEMGGSWDTIVAALAQNPTDQTEFGAIYADGVTQANITDAIAEYERYLVTPSRFDAFLRGDQSQLDEQEQRGWATFQSVGCIACHRGVNVGGGMYQRMGLVRNYFELRGTPLTEADNGRFNVTHQETDRHFFKVPTLRNIELTAPYFHDGSQPELAGAVRTMGQVQLGRDLTDAQVNDIVAFLRTLTGELPAEARMPSAATVADPSAAATGEAPAAVAGGTEPSPGTPPGATPAPAPAGETATPPAH
jgi:cytochrome c peroxidase